MEAHILYVVGLVDSAKQAVHLATAARNLLRGGFDMHKVDDAKQLVAGASSLWHSLSHRGEHTPEGLGKENFVENWEEGKDVWMFSGCRDDQTSADTFVDSTATGAMSWAFIGTMLENPQQTYVQVLQNTRRKLAGKYKQVPQLSVSVFNQSFVRVKLTGYGMSMYQCQCGGAHRFACSSALKAKYHSLL